MAKMEINDDISLEKLANLPDGLISDMLNAGADVVARFQKEEIQNLWTGPYSEKISPKCIKKGKVKKKKDGHAIYVYPQGERRRGKEKIRNAEIAFLNEHGAPKRDIVERPAIKIANRKAEDAAIAAMEKVLDDYLEKMGF